MVDKLDNEFDALGQKDNNNERELATFSLSSNATQAVIVTVECRTSQV
jgi:hypothetical protein